MPDTPQMRHQVVTVPEIKRVEQQHEEMCLNVRNAFFTCIFP